MKTFKFKWLLLSIILSIASINTAWADATPVYLDATSTWDKDGAKFAVYIQKSDNSWYFYPNFMTKVTGTDHVYRAEMDVSAKTVIFIRKSNTASAANNWNDVWKQTHDYGFTDKNFFTISSTESDYKQQISSASLVNNSGGTVYFEKPAGWTNTNRYFAQGNDGHTSLTSLTAITNTGLYYCTVSAYKGASYMAFCATSSGWSSGNWGYSNISGNAGQYTGQKLWYNLNSGSAYLATSSGTSNLEVNSIGSDYNGLNKNQTVYKYTSVDNGSSYSAASHDAGTVTISAVKMKNASTANNTSNSATINAAGTTSTSVYAVYTGTVTLTAAEKTGYSWVGWFNVASGGSAVSTNKSYSYTAAHSEKSMYARFKANQYTITLNKNDGSGTSDTQTATYGVAAASRSSARPTRTGYAFDGYYTAASGGTQVINKNGDWNSNVSGLTDSNGKWICTSAQTLHAHWLETGWYIVGDFVGGWDATTANKFDNTTKKCTITVADHGIYSGDDFVKQFKICKVEENTASAKRETLYGKNSGSTPAVQLGKSNKTATGLTSGASDHAIKQELYYDGDYVYTLSTSGPDITVDVPVIDKLYIYNSNPSGGAGVGNTAWDGAPVSNKVTKTVALSRSTTYEFKAVYDSEFWSKSPQQTLTRASNSISSITHSGSEPNTKITTDVAGNYTFELDMTSSKEKITVTYPTIRKVNYSIVTLNGGTGTSGTLTVTNDDDGNVNISTLSNYVANGNHVTFAAPAAKTGYTWRGWFNKNNPSNWEDGLLSSNATYSNVTISGGDKTVYAIYSQDDYTVAVVASAGGSVASESVSAHYDNKVTLPTATPDAGYYFTGWEKTEGTATLYSTSSASAAQIDGVTSSNTVTVRANFHADDKIYFDNTYTKWSKVYVYLFNNNVWYDNKEGDDGPGVKPNHSNRVAFAEMTKVKGTTNLYEYAYHTPSVNYTFSHVAFCKDNQSTYNAFYNTDAVYRNDWDDKLRVYVAPAGYTTPLINGTKYHGDKNNNAGYWRVYNPKAGDNAYYYLDQFCAHGSTFPDGQYFKASGDGALVAEISARLTSASTDYSFGVHSAGTTNLHFATSHTFTVDDSEDIKLYKYNSDWNFTLKTTSEGIYTFVLSMEHDSLRLSVIYPASVNDYRIKFTENGKSHYSDIIKKKTADAGVVTTSMYINKGGTSPSLKLEQCTSITAGVPTWTERKDFGFTGFGSKGVYVMDLTVSGTNGISSTLSNISAYSGPYYIKTDGASGGWQNYKQNVMDENSLNFDAEHPDKSFNYYYCKYYNSAGTNLKCVIANDYCNALTDTLKGDAVIGVGNQTTPSAANVRFSYNSYTNEINRSYLGSSVASDFLRILGNTTDGKPHIYDKDETTFDDSHDDAYIKFEDKQNWRYEIDIKADVNARAKLTATFNSQTQYFMGAEGDFSNANTEQLFGGTSGTYGLTLVYDFKTNKLIRAWKPTGDAINSDLSLNSDLILLREHQGAPTPITFGTKAGSGEYASLSDVKTVYGVLRFNRWKLSNRAYPTDVNTEHCKTPALIEEHHPELAVNQDNAAGKWLPQAERELYFISFPFDVKMSDIIHFGGYYNTWGIMYYDGKGRAKNGYWIDSESNWKYFTPEEFATDTLKAYEGYLIGIDLAIMAYNNTSFWTNNSSEVDIYFPSQTAVSTITQQAVNVPINQTGYLCTINRDFGGSDGDRRVKDSYWHCIGVPAYANLSHDINSSEPYDETWSNKSLLYLYEWDSSTNEHTIKEASSFSFQAMYAYLVQYAGTTLSWSAAAVSPSSIAARRMKTEELRDRQFNLQLLQGDKEADHTYIRLSDDEEVTTGFEFNHDVSKMMLSGANIYTLIGKEQAAANSLPLNLEQTTTIPVGVKIATNGDYTFSISEGTQGVGVTLIDNETGSRTNLSALDYEISLEEGTYDERFMLEISPIMHTPTSVEGITGDESHVTNARKVMIDGLLYIVKDGVIYDARGAVIK